MNTTCSSRLGQDLLANMARIPLVIPGTLSKRRDSNGKITGWKLQRWHNGRNQTRYVLAEHLDRIREGTEGCTQFMTLARQYVETKGQEALESLNQPADSKKKPMKR